MTFLCCRNMNYSFSQDRQRVACPLQHCYFFILLTNNDLKSLRKSSYFKIQLRLHLSICYTVDYSSFEFASISRTFKTLLNGRGIQAETTPLPHQCKISNKKTKGLNSRLGVREYNVPSIPIAVVKIYWKIKGNFSRSVAVSALESFSVLIECLLSGLQILLPFAQWQTPGRDTFQSLME